MTVMVEGQPSVWVSYVSVDDADATTDMAGAAVFVEPMKVSNIGPRRRRRRGDQDESDGNLRLYKLERMTRCQML